MLTERAQEKKRRRIGKGISLLYGVLSCRLAVLLLAYMVVSTLAFGQSYQEGYKKYTAGDMVGAEGILARAVKESMPPAKKAQAYKILGVAQYNQGKKSEALASFKSALALNASSVIRSDEVFDASVVGFFTKIKSSAEATAKKAKTPEPSSPGDAPGRQAKSAKNDKAAANTRFVIKANADAHIYIDGILVGNAGDELDTKAGWNSAVLKAKGYKNKSVKMNIKPGVVNEFHVDLIKVVSAPQPAKTTVAAHVAKPAKRKKAKSSQNQMFPDEDSDYKSQPVALPMLPEPSPDYPPPPAQPMSAPAAVPEFPPPAPTPGPAPLPQPVAPTAAPAPAAQPAAPTAIPAPAAQPATPTPVPAPAMQSPTPYYGPAPAAAPPANYYAAPNMKNRKSRQEDSPQSISLLTFLPFGMGQFAGGSMYMGTLFASTQAAALIVWYSNRTEAQNAYVIVQQIDADRIYSNDPNKRQQYRGDVAAYINQHTQTAQEGLIAFGSIWALGVAEALVAPGHKTTKSLALEEPVIGPHNTPCLPVASYRLLAADAPPDATAQHATLLVEPEFNHPNIVLAFGYKF